MAKEPATTMVRQSFLLLLLLGTSGLFAAEPEPEYTRTRELPALKMNFTDMQSVLDKAAHLIADANKGFKEAREAREAKGSGSQNLFPFFQTPPRETLTLGTGPDEIQIEGHRFPVNARLPKRAYALSYSYLWKDAPLSTLRLELGDSTRRLTVNGTSVDQVEAISAALERDLTQHSAIGGFELRSGISLFTGLVLVLLLVILGGYCIFERQWRFLGIPIFSLVGLVLLFALPLKDLLAGFAVYEGDPSWMVRYGPQMAFASFILTIAGIILSFLIPMWHQKAA